MALRGFVAPDSPARADAMGRGEVEWRPMKFVRTHQSLIAWMLYGIVLFSGLVCSLSHGQMLRAFNQLNAGVECSEHHELSGRIDMAQMGDHAQLMKLSMTDCAFAGTAVLALVFFIRLSWRTRPTYKSLPRSDCRLRRPPRQTFPGIAPQAP